MLMPMLMHFTDGVRGAIPSFLPSFLPYSTTDLQFRVDGKCSIQNFCYFFVTCSVAKTEALTMKKSIQGAGMTGEAKVAQEDGKGDDMVGAIVLNVVDDALFFGVADASGNHSLVITSPRSKAIDTPNSTYNGGTANLPLFSFTIIKKGISGPALLFPLFQS